MTLIAVLVAAGYGVYREMVSNLLVVLCADREPQPVINTGTIYQ